jgi:phospholipase A1
MPPKPYRFFSVLALFVLHPALAQQGVPDLSGCARIPDATQRLACYDRLPGAGQPSAQAAAAATCASVPAAAAADREVEASLDLSPEKTRGFSLADHWELDQEHRRGVFNFRPHHANYLMVTRTAHLNNEPYRPFRDIADLTTDLSRAELVFQLGF